MIDVRCVFFVVCCFCLSVLLFRAWLRVVCWLLLVVCCVLFEFVVRCALCVCCLVNASRCALCVVRCPLVVLLVIFVVFEAWCFL